MQDQAEPERWNGTISMLKWKLDPQQSFFIWRSWHWMNDPNLTHKSLKILTKTL